MTVVDVVLGSLVLGLAGWALVQTGRPRPAGGGGCGCGSSGCGPRDAEKDDEALVTLGDRERDPTGDR